MSDRKPTKEELGRWLSAKKPLDGHRDRVAAIKRQVEELGEVLERETMLLEHYQAKYDAVIADLGGTPEAPTPGPEIGKDGKPVPGWHADWIVKG